MRPWTEESDGGIPAAERFLRRFRSAWMRSVAARASLAGATTLLGGWAVLVAVDLAVSIPAPVRVLLRLLPFAAALGIALLRLRALVPPPPPLRLALRAEEEFPELRQLLTTALGPPPAGEVGQAFQARVGERLRSLHPVRRVPLRGGRLPGVLAGATLVLALLAVAGGPRQVWDRWMYPSSVPAAVEAWVRGGGAEVPAEVFGTLLVEGVGWTVTPPGYTGRPSREVDDAAAVEALPGSRVRIRAAAPPEGVRLVARLVEETDEQSAGASLTGSTARGVWAAEWTVSTGHRGLTLELHREGEVVARRVIPLLLVEDRPPEVRLLLPDADLVVAGAMGEVPVRAMARDDVGLRRFALTWIHTSGSGESFSFRQGEWEWDRVTTQDGWDLGETTLELADTGLQPGDVLHVRAFALDGNDVTGPGEGVSATRVIRVVRPGEEAEITTLLGFPLEGEPDPVLSQRMIILMTEELRDERHPAASPPLMQGGAGIASEQGRLRDVVGEEIYVRLAAEEDPGAADPSAAAGHTHDHPAAVGPRPGAPDTSTIRVIPGGEEALERALQLARTLEEASRATGTGMPDEEMHLHDASPILSMNPTRLLAFNAMWAAERELRQGALEAALVHQYRALDYIQEMREENRVFPRGTQRVAPIDVEGVRGTGRMRDVAPVARETAPAGPDAAMLAARLEAAMEVLPTLSPARASLELGEVALRLLGSTGVDPTAPALVSEAATAAGRGDTVLASALLARARAALVPGARGGPGAPIPTATTPVSAEYFRLLGGDAP